MWHPTHLFVGTLLVFLLGLWGDQAVAEPIPKATFAVHFTAADPDSDWVASALERYAIATLGSFERLEPTFAPRPPCAPGAVPCLLAAYHHQGAELLLTGVLDKERLQFQVYEAWTKSRVFTGIIPLNVGMDPLRVRQTLITAMNPVLRSGGLLEQREFLRAKTLERQGAHMTPPKKRRTAAGTLAVVLVVLLTLPYLAVSIAGAPRLLRRTPTLKWSLGLMVIIAGVLGTYAIPALARVVWSFTIPEAWLRYQTPLTALSGGAAWGVLMILAARLAWPALDGAERAEAQSLGLVLRGWIIWGGVRSLFVMAWGALVGLGAMWVARAWHLDAWTTGTVAAPGLALVALYLGACFVDAASAYLDYALVDDSKPQDDEDLRQYFTGHAQRLAVSVPKRILERALFLPGRTPEVVAYGGGLTPPRFVVGVQLRRVAFGTAGPSTALPASQVTFAQWLGGRVLPWGSSSAGTAGAPPEDFMVLAPLPEGSAEPSSSPLFEAPPRTYEPLGRLESLMGTIVPTPQHVITFAQEQTGVRNLLAMRRLATSTAPRDDDHRSQRDFLFGGLLWSMGAVLRGDAMLTSVTLAARLWTERHLPRLAALMGKLLSRLLELWRRLTGDAATLVADAYVALHNGVHHLVQYLAYLRWRDPGLLTARATQVELVNVTQRIIDRLLGEKASPDAREAQVRRRLMGLSRYTHAPVEVAQNRRLRLALVAAAALGLLAFTAHSTLEAIRYHPTFVQRMNAARTPGAQGGEHGKHSNH